MSKRDLDKYFPRDGPCFCHPMRYARHRVTDAIRERHAAGESVAGLARDYGVTRGAIRAALDSTPDDNRMNKSELREARGAV